MYGYLWCKVWLSMVQGMAIYGAWYGYLWCKVWLSMVQGMVYKINRHYKAALEISINGGIQNISVHGYLGQHIEAPDRIICGSTLNY